MRGLFSENLDEQRRKLMTMLGMAVSNLHRWDAISPQVRQLGRRHAGYGVTLADYDTVGTALIDTLEKGLGEAFSPPIREAWVACYATIAAEMQKAAIEHVEAVGA